MLGQGCIQGVHRPGQITHTQIPVPARSLRKNGGGTLKVLVKRQDNADGDTAERSELASEAAALFELVVIMRAVSFPFSKLVHSLL